METYLVLTLSSLFGIGVSFSLFLFEANRGTRFGEPVRARLDQVVRVWTDRVCALFRVFERTAIRQSVHYLFHTFLRVVLGFLRSGERYLENTIRVNRGVAKRIVREGEYTNKLGKVVDHQRENALTDEEKKVERAKSLEG